MHLVIKSSHHSSCTLVHTATPKSIHILIVSRKVFNPWSLFDLELYLKSDLEEKGQVNSQPQDKACQKKKSKNVFGDACGTSVNIDLRGAEQGLANGLNSECFVFIKKAHIYLTTLCYSLEDGKVI